MIDGDLKCKIFQLHCVSKVLSEAYSGLYIIIMSSSTIDYFCLGSLNYSEIGLALHRVTVISSDSDLNVDVGSVSGSVFSVPLSTVITRSER